MFTVKLSDCDEKLKDCVLENYETVEKCDNYKKSSRKFERF